MSTQQVTATLPIHFIEKVGVFAPSIRTNLGDIFQNYSGENFASPLPDFVAAPTKHTLYIDEGCCTAGLNYTLPLEEFRFELGNMELSFDDEGQCTTEGFKGCFRVSTETTNGRARRHLQIVGNLVEPLGGMSSYITAHCVVLTGGAKRFALRATTPITIAKRAGVSNVVSILFAQSKNTITTASESVTMIAQLFAGGTEAVADTSDYSFEWYKFAAGNWQRLSNTPQLTEINTAQLKAYEKAVDGATLFKVLVNKGGKLFGTDTAIALDLQDPLQVSILGSDNFEEGTTETYQVAIRRGREALDNFTISSAKLISEVGNAEKKVQAAGKEITLRTEDFFVEGVPMVNAIIAATINITL